MADKKLIQTNTIMTIRFLTAGICILLFTWGGNLSA